MRMEGEEDKIWFLWIVYSFWLQIDPASIEMNVSPLELHLLKLDSVVTC